MFLTLTGYLGCFEDKSPYRDLPTVLSVPHLTPDSCRSACQGAGHAYAGVQYGYLCRCGDSYGKYNKVPDEECNALCTGDKAQKCGGFWRSAIFTTGKSLEDKIAIRVKLLRLFLTQKFDRKSLTPIIFPFSLPCTLSNVLHPKRSLTNRQTFNKHRVRIETFERKPLSIGKNTRAFYVHFSQLVLL